MIIDRELIEKIKDICCTILGDKAELIYLNSESYEESYEDDEVIFLSNIKEPFFISSTDEYTVHFGASKLVIVPKYEDFVLKFDIDARVVNDRTNDDKDWNWKIVEVVNDYDRTLRREEAFYSSIKNEVIAKVIMPVQFVCKYNGISVFVQEKFKDTIQNDVDYFSDKKTSQDTYNFYYENMRSKAISTFPRTIKEKISSLTQFYSFSAYSYFIYLNWIKRFGFDKTYEIAKAIDIQDLTDLHSSNVVIDNTGLVRISDYGGYDECDHWHCV